MCELNAILIKDGIQQTIMEGVVRVEVSDEGKSMDLYDIFSEHMHIEGTIASIDITKQRLVINV